VIVSIYTSHGQSSLAEIIKEGKNAKRRMRKKTLSVKGEIVECQIVISLSDKCIKTLRVKTTNARRELKLGDILFATQR
jgi:hypothetical protein